jgi:hypothetical protein
MQMAAESSNAFAKIITQPTHHQRYEQETQQKNHEPALTPSRHQIHHNPSNVNERAVIPSPSTMRRVGKEGRLGISGDTWGCLELDLRLFEKKTGGEYLAHKLAGSVTILGLDYWQDFLFIAICDAMVMIWLWR